MNRRERRAQARADERLREAEFPDMKASIPTLVEAGLVTVTEDGTCDTTEELMDIFYEEREMPDDEDVAEAVNKARKALLNTLVEARATVMRRTGVDIYKAPGES